MTPEIAKSIILYAVEITQPRWLEYDQSWKNIDRDFIHRGYEQGGFQIFKMTPLFDQREIYSIENLGSILEKRSGARKYNRDYAGSLASPFYADLKLGEFGRTGVLFYECVNSFLTERLGKPGRFFWRIMWNLLVCCNFLRQHYSSSFSEFLKTQYAQFKDKQRVSDTELLNASNIEWTRFLKEKKPWRDLYGIGENVFDFIVGDVIEARFAKDSYKFDSANQYFLDTTGIADQIIPFDRENTIRFLKGLNLQYTLREINKGIYTYCSETEGSNFGFCRTKAKCIECKVSDLCYQRITAQRKH